MTEEQAQALANHIKEQFPHVFTYALESIDTRNAPRHWFVAVRCSEVVDGERALILNHEYEWQEALTALHVLSA